MWMTNKQLSNLAFIKFYGAYLLIENRILNKDSEVLLGILNYFSVLAS